ncbi:hypothetical protein DFP72DRAFT_823825 [Ephemerocybe angulata]|uniref:Uncharacterized protein n=1 Tax=Ephemerocybe angulata TaxID=980116 RepID=A0A8H6HH68_9AGAR|nr:hypothetical protein DFP72DRAFT_823825 [Tulosesus angulatus]
MCGRYRTQTISGDRLKRVQEIERFHSTESSNSDALEADSKLLLIHDPIATLVACDQRIWLVLGEVNGIRYNGEAIDRLGHNLLVEAAATVSFQPLGLRPATSDDDNSEKYDWRTFNLLIRSFEVPAACIEPLDPEVRTREGKTFHLHQSPFLVATTSLLLQRMQPAALKNLPKMVLRKACFVAQTSSEELTDIANANTSECSACTPAVRLDLSHGQRVLEHIACHILFDETTDRTALPCGLCLLPPSKCKYFVVKGRGAKANLRIDSERSGGCGRSVNFVYGIAALSTRTSPCSNVPLRCPLCSKAEPAVWRYNLELHFIDCHPTASTAEYSALWTISSDEMAAMRKIWKEIKERQRKGPKKQYRKSNAPKLVISEAHSTQTIPQYVFFHPKSSASA